jgi:uncharacterized membrane protein YedE/YeeE
MTGIILPLPRKALAQIVTALVVGTIFGFGLALSGMMDPKRVRGFLDIAGSFDPSLGFVLFGALAVSGLGYAISRHMRGPLFDTGFHLPPRRDIDRRLLVGAAIFGIGWGVAGLCPGPAIASLPLGLPETFVFTAAMLAGLLLYDRIAPAISAQSPIERPAAQQDADARI